MKRGMTEVPIIPSLLFNITIEILAALAVHQNQMNRGILTSSLEHKILLHADNAVFAMCNPDKSLNVLKEILH